MRPDPPRHQAGQRVAFETGAAAGEALPDFGLARAADDAGISQSGLVAGTPMYMAPEQAKGETLDQRADLFSLGSVLYQMAAGRPPFRANGTVAVLKRVAEDQPRAIREIIPETPQWLCDIIAKLHAKNPDDRFQSAREVADVLADCEVQLKAHAKLKDYSRIPRSDRRRFGRRKWVAAAAVLLLVVALGVAEFAGVTHLFRQQATPNADKLDSERKPGPGAVQDPLPTGLPEMPRDAILLMNFEKDTFYQKDGKTYVRDLSGHGNDGLCEDVAFTPDGKAGGGLLCQGGQLRIGKSLINHQANYTITAWCRSDKAAGPLYVYWVCKQADPNAVCFKATGSADQKNFGVEAWNCKLDNRGVDAWRHAVTDFEAAHGRDWFFVAASLRDGVVDGGNLRVFVNDQRYNFTFQTAEASPGTKGLVDLVGYNTSGAVIDELAVFQRALSDQEIMAIRALGLNGTALGRGNLAPLPTVAPFTDADVQRITALPAEQQVEEVRMELMRRNPGFDGKMETKIEDGVVTELRIVTDQVTDIAPIRVWGAIRVLECGGTWTNGPSGLLADLTPLQGMAALTHLNLMQTKVTDAGIAYLKSCKDLKYLNLNNTRVTDKGLAHLKDCQALAILDMSATKVTDQGLANLKDCRALTHLLLGGTKVSDAGLANFKGMPLMLLWIDNTGVTDLTPLQGMPLEEIYLTPKNITRGLDILRDMKSLKTIGIDFNHAWPAAEFWERYDKGEFKE